VRVNRDVVIAAAVLALLALYRKPSTAQAGAPSPLNAGDFFIPDPSNPGGFISTNAQTYCGVNPGDPICQNQQYYGATVPGYLISGTVPAGVASVPS
jgi:hypothetical protein